MLTPTFCEAVGSGRLLRHKMHQDASGKVVLHLICNSLLDWMCFKKQQCPEGYIISLYYIYDIYDIYDIYIYREREIVLQLCAHCIQLCCFGRFRSQKLTTLRLSLAAEPCAKLFALARVLVGLGMFW